MDEQYRERIQGMLKNFSCILLFSAFILKMFTVFQYVNLHIATVFIWGAFIFLCFYLCLEKYIFSENHFLHITLFIFIAITACSGFYARDPEAAANITSAWFTNILFFISIAFWCRDDKVWHSFVSIVLACFCIELLYGAYQYFIDLPALRLEVKEAPEVLDTVKNTVSKIKMFNARLQNERIFGHFILPNTYGSYLCMFLPLLWSIVVCCYSKIRNYFAIFSIFFLLALFNIYLAKSKGSILSFAILLGAYFLIYFRYKFKDKKFFLLVAIVFIFSTICTCIIFFTNYFDFIGNSSVTFLNRTEYWNVSYHIWQENLFFGIGIDNFSEYFYSFKPMWLEEVNNPHNFYVQYLTETGLVGISAFFFLMFALLRRLFSYSLRPLEKQGNVQLHNFVIPISIVVASVFTYITGVFTVDISDVNYIAKTFSFDISVPVLEFLFFVSMALIFLLTASFCRNQDIRSFMLRPMLFGIVFFLVHSFIDIDFYVHNLNLLFWSFVALCISQTHNESKPVLVWHKKAATFLLLLFIFFQVYLLVTASKKLEEHNHLATSQLLESQMSSSKNANEYQETMRNYYTHLEQVLKIEPDNVNHRLRMGITILRSLYDHIKKYSVQVNVGEIKKLINLIQVAEDHILYVEANNKYLKIKYLTPISHFYLTQSEIWRELRQPKNQKISIERALVFAQRALALYPNSADLSLLCAEISEKLGQNKETLRYYQQALLISDTVYPAGYGVELEKRKIVYQKINHYLKVLGVSKEK